MILLVCCINMYFVVIYVTVLDSVWLYVLAAFLCIGYLGFVDYLVSIYFSLGCLFITESFVWSVLKVFHSLISMSCNAY